jgi:phosphatidylinositol phospholipase C delta
MTEKLSFKGVCQAIASADEQDQTALPIVISLECHVPPEKQPHMVDIMKEVFGDRLVTDKLDGKDQITLADALNKILVKVSPALSSSVKLTAWQVEHIGVWPNRLPISDATLARKQEEEVTSSEDSSDDEAAKEARKQKRQKPKIIPQLSKLGVYSKQVVCALFVVLMF